VWQPPGGAAVSARPVGEARRQEVGGLLVQALSRGDDGNLRAYLMGHSNLPGPRGNLELAADFAHLVAELPPEQTESARILCLRWTEIDADTGPVGDPTEYLPFCAAWALGSLAARTGQHIDDTIERLYRLAADPRWRLREAVANGLQALLADRTAETLAALERWIEPGHWLPMRAVAAAVAEPSLLQDPALAAEAVVLHHLILDQASAATERGPDFRVLRQGLGYTVSVVVASRASAGPALLERLAASTDPDLRWILRENLKNNRLRRARPDLVGLLSDSL